MKSTANRSTIMVLGIVGAIVLVLAVVCATFIINLGTRAANLAWPALMPQPTTTRRGSPTITFESTSIGNEQKRAELSGAILARDAHQVTALLDSHPPLVNTGNMIGETPLFDAAFTDNASVAMLLIQRGADVNAVSKLGETPMDKAVAFQHYDMVELLKKHGARRGKSR